MWSQDGHIYFVSDREGAGLTNLWRVREGGGISGFNFSRDGRTLFFREGNGVYSVPMPGGAGGSPAFAAATAASRGEQRRAA